MDFFVNYFTPAILIIVFSLIPLYFIRMIYFVRKSHFVDETLSLNLSLYMHIFIYFMFVAHLFFYTKDISSLALYIFGFAMIMFLGILLGYRQKFRHIKRNRYSVLYSKWNNREKFQQFLDDKKYSHVDIMDGSFSYVTKIKFNDCSKLFIDTTFKEIEEQEELLYPFNSFKGYCLFALNTALFFGSIVAFVIFFVYIPRLGN